MKVGGKELRKGDWNAKMKEGAKKRVNECLNEERKVVHMNK